MGLSRAAVGTSRTSWAAAACCVLLGLRLPAVATAALVRPLESQQGLHAVLDYYEQGGADGAVDVVLVCSIANDQLAFKELFGGGQTGLLRVTATLAAPDGRRYERDEELRISARTREEAASRTVYQVFTLRLAGVDAADAVLTCRLEDLDAARVLRLESAEAPPPAAVIAGEWYRDPARADAHGLWLHAPLFLSGAPVRVGGVPGDRDLAAYLHPNRRYGIEQERLQVTFDVEAAGLDASNRGHLPRRLLMQVMSRDLDYAVRDTVPLDLDPVAFVAGGGLASVTWEYDVNRLPPGTYQLSCAPLDGWGNAWIVEFDVIWSLRSFVRPAPEIDLVGRIVLTGDLRERFLAAGLGERQAILADFWGDVDPVPETAVNEAAEEFRRRMSYVNKYLGGFGHGGPLDDRGLVYLLLGPPDDVQQQVVPVNANDFEDALAQVYDSFLSPNNGLVLRDAYAEDEMTNQAIRERLDRANSQERFKAYELWKYNDNGAQLFPNQYSAMPLGLNFLFLARLGGSTYTLEATNVWDRGDPAR
jgi:GWxTD domain-containing protein